MIKSFAKGPAEKIWQGTTLQGKFIPGSLVKIAKRKLEILHAATELNELRLPPGNKLEKLQGNLAAFYSIRINDQFRIIFKWKDGNAFDVDILDYH